MENQATMKSMRRGELAANTGCNLETIRYYEKIGLLPAPPRSDNGYRQYCGEHERRLRFIMRGRGLGFSLDDIRSLLGMEDGAPTCGDVQELTHHHLDAVRLKIADLKRLERTLSRIAKQCEGGETPKCPIIDALYGKS